MKFLAMIAIMAGCGLAILIERVIHKQWNEFFPILGMVLIPNALTVGIAVLVFRRADPNLRAYQILVSASYLVGIGGGIYLDNT